MDLHIPKLSQFKVNSYLDKQKDYSKLFVASIASTVVAAVVIIQSTACCCYWCYNSCSDGIGKLVVVAATGYTS